MKQYAVVRYGLGRNSTLGILRKIVSDGEDTDWCFTLEDERRLTKVPGETCIPVGTYPLKLRTDGMDDPKMMNFDYRKRYGDWHKGMIELQNVPGFTSVYIHILNYEHQTKGCVGVGLVPSIHPDGEFWIGRSADAYKQVYEEIATALIAGEACVLHITEMQPWA